jgi:ferredoxin
LEVKFKLEGVLVMSGNKVPKVWIDQDLCTGDGLCTEISPAVFEMRDDGLAYVIDRAGEFITGVAGSVAKVPVPEGELENVIEAAEECPGGCIFIEKV